MIGAVNTWMKVQLAALGVPEARIFTDPAELAGIQPVPFVVVMVDRELVKRDGSRVGTEDAQDGKTRTIRSQLWARGLPLRMHLVHDSLAHAEEAVNAFLLAAFVGPEDDGNRIRVACRGIDWIGDKSRLDGRVRVDIDLVFAGGVFRDQVVPLVKDVMPRPVSGQAHGA